MRAKSGEKITVSRPAAMVANSPELIPNKSSPAMDYI
jgi:hypothetical protein